MEGSMATVLVMIEARSFWLVAYERKEVAEALFPAARPTTKRAATI